MADAPRLIERPMVSTVEGLRALVAELRAAGRFALDTEFSGERTYVPRLCLVQVATTEFIALIDSLAIRDLAPFWDLLLDPSVEKVLHAAREDLRIAYFGSGRVVAANVFDTQVAAALVGLSQYPLSYARLVEALQSVRLPKTETRSEWDRRPLTPEQILYARDDVRYLLPMADRLKSLLSRLNRTDWLRQEMERFADPRTFEADPDEAYLRLRIPRGGLTARATSMLKELAAWRERYASDNNMPARSILRDETLLEIVQRSPKRVTDLTRIRNFPVGEEGTLGHSVMVVLEQVRSIRPEDLPEALTAAEDETPAQKVLIDVLNAVGAAYCLQQNIAPEIAVTRSSVAEMIRPGSRSVLRSGWRYDAVGRHLLSFIEGRAALQVVVQNGEVIPAFQARPDGENDDAVLGAPSDESAVAAIEAPDDESREAILDAPGDVG